MVFNVFEQLDGQCANILFLLATWRLEKWKDISICSNRYIEQIYSSWDNIAANSDFTNCYP